MVDIDNARVAPGTSKGTSHQLSNILIVVDGDTATSESYVHACIRMDENDIVVRGRYLDTWSRRDGEWRIDERRYENDLTQVIPVNEPFGL